MTLVTLICLAAGTGISLLVSLFKRLAFVAAYPKVIAFILSGVTAGAMTAFGHIEGVEEISACTLVPFAGAIATYEAGTRQVRKAMS